jgi:putative sterol carrier protein
MAIFHSTEQLYAILQLVFEQVSTQPAQLEPFTKSNLVIRIRLQNPTAEVLLDGRQPPLEVFYGERPGQANLEISLPADLLHAIWLGTESASGAFFGGKVKVKGNMMKALPLMDLFRECERVYPQIAAEAHLV